MACARVFVALIVAALIRVGDFAAYTGKICEGVVDFDINVADQSVTDYAVGVGVNQTVSIWMTPSCRQAIQGYYCLQIYVPYAVPTTTFCPDACTALLDACGKFWTLGTLAESLRAGLDSQCTKGDPSSCISGNTSAVESLSVQESQCPTRLVIPNKESYKSYSEVHEVVGTACAIACPSFWYLPPEFKRLSSGLLAGYIASFVFAVLALMGQVKAKRLIIGLYICILVTVTFIAVIITDLSGAPDGSNTMLCTGNAGYIPRHPGIVFEAFFVIFCALFGYTVVLAITLKLWYPIIYHRLPAADYEITILKWIGWFPFVAVIVVASAGNLGYDYLAQSIIPNFLLSETKSYFWAFFVTPLGILGHLQLFLLCHLLYVSTTSVMRTVEATHTGSTFDKFKSMLQKVTHANRRVFTFLVLQILLVLVVIWLLVYYNGIYSDTLKDKTFDYVACMLEHSRVTVPDDFYDLCGPVPQVPKWVYVLLNGIQAIIGATPLLVFGANDCVTAVFSVASKAAISTYEKRHSTAPRKEVSLSHTRGNNSSTHRTPSDA